MKNASLAYRAFVMLLCSMSVLVLSCNSPTKTVEQNQNLKDLDKNTLLAMIDSVAKTWGKEGAKVQKAKNVVKWYKARYKFKVNGLDTANTDTGNVFVNFIGDQTVMFGLSKGFQKQISFTDLKSKFGQWTVGVLPKEVITVPVSFTIKGHANDVQVFVHSAKFPEEKDNAINDITVMR